MDEKAGILVRVSTSDQAEGKTSLTTQLDACANYCKRQGWQVVAVEQDAQTGTNFDRPGFRKLAEAAKQGAFQKLVVYDHSRFGRDQLSARVELREFISAGVEVHSVVKGGVLEDSMIDNILLLVAEDFSRNLSGKVKLAMTSRAETGHWTHRPSFGYDLVPCTDHPGCKGKKLAPNSQAHIMTEAFERADTGQTLASIRDWLRDEHDMLVEINPWLTSHLKNPIYVGDVLVGKRSRSKFLRQSDPIVVTDAHERLIDRDTFHRVQVRFKAPRPISTPLSKPLDGLLFCGLCGARMYRVTGGNKRKYSFYYACSAQRRYKTCAPNQMPYGRIETALDAQIDEMFPSVDRSQPNPALRVERRAILHRLLEVVKPDIQRLQSGANTVHQRNEAERKRIEREIANLVSAVAAGVFTNEEAAPQMAELREALAGNKLEAKNIKTTTGTFDIDEAIVELQIPALARAEGELIRLLVERIVVQAGTVTVAWSDYANEIAQRTDGWPSTRFTNSLVNQTDGSPSRRPGAGTLTLCSK